MSKSYVSSLVKQFQYYESLGERAMGQLSDEALFWQYNNESNSISILANHLAGNMLSRFTDWMTSDGEKAWRNRDAEFEQRFGNREELMTYWHKGWDCLLGALEEIYEEHLANIVYIRNEGHTVTEALNRQLAHYAYHVGQMVYVAKMAQDHEWKCLSILRNKSNDYNSRKFNQEKAIRHFTEDNQIMNHSNKPNDQH